MNSTGDSLRLAILANPTDNLPRLVYADWLEENGEEELAHFIRLQYGLTSLPAGDYRRVQLEQKQRLAIIANGEKWASGAIPTPTISGNFGLFDKLKPSGMICRLPADHAKLPEVRSYVFDLSDLEHWTENTIDWSDFEMPINWYRRSIEHSWQDKSGIAFTNGFPSHWRGKCLDWFTGVGREAVKNYPIIRVEFCNLLNGYGHVRTWNGDLSKRYPNICLGSRLVEQAEINDIQTKLSRLVIEAVR